MDICLSVNAQRIAIRAPQPDLLGREFLLGPMRPFARPGARRTLSARSMGTRNRDFSLSAALAELHFGEGHRAAAGEYREASQMEFGRRDIY